MADDTAAAAAENELVLDLDALVPVPRGKVRFKGVDYPVMSIVDIPSADAVEVLRIDKDVTGKPLSQQVELLRQAARFLVPSFTDEVLERMTMTELVKVSLTTIGVAKADATDPAGPPVAGKGPDSPTS